MVLQVILSHIMNYGSWTRRKAAIRFRCLSELQWTLTCCNCSWVSQKWHKTTEPLTPIIASQETAREHTKSLAAVNFGVGAGPSYGTSRTSGSVMSGFAWWGRSTHSWQNILEHAWHQYAASLEHWGWKHVMVKSVYNWLWIEINEHDYTFYADLSFAKIHWQQG